MVNLLSPRSDQIKTFGVQFWDGLDFPSFSQFVSFKCQFDRRRDNDTWSRKARTDVGARASSYIPAAAAAGWWWLEARDPRNQNWSCLLPLLHFCLPFTLHPSASDKASPCTELNWSILVIKRLNCRFSYKTYCCIEKHCTLVTKLFKCNCVQSAPEKCKVEKSSEPSDKGPISDKMSVLKFLELLKSFNVKVPFKSFMLLFSDTATSQI